VLRRIRRLTANEASEVAAKINALHLRLGRLLTTRVQADEISKGKLCRGLDEIGV
jgi:hypothetical protein